MSWRGGGRLEREINRRKPILDLVENLEIYQSFKTRCSQHSEEVQWAKFMLALPSKFDKSCIEIQTDWQKQNFDLETFFR